jgi:hypothetical protein
LQMWAEAASVASSALFTVRRQQLLRSRDATILPGPFFGGLLARGEFRLPEKVAETEAAVIVGHQRELPGTHEVRSQRGLVAVEMHRERDAAHGPVGANFPAAGRHRDAAFPERLPFAIP